MEDSSAGIGGLIVGIIYLAIIVLVVASLWKVFVKAGQPGWHAIVPIFNIVVLARIAGRPGWWAALFLVPIVSFVIAIIIGLDLAKQFGKGAGFGLGLTFLGFVFYPILGFGDATYRPVAR